MGKSKYFAFFQTEEQFVKFMFNYLEEHPEVLRARDAEIRRVSRLWERDHMNVSLGRMGFREAKFKELKAMSDAVIKEYMQDYSEDMKADEKMEYSRTCLDRELAQYMGSLFVPEEERYK